MSPQSYLSTNGKGDEMIPGAVQRSPGICLMADENLGKPQLGDRLMKAVRTVIVLIGSPLPPNEVGRIAKQARKGEGRK